jgi:hypothetical protein
MIAGEVLPHGVGSYALSRCRTAAASHDPTVKKRSRILIGTLGLLIFCIIAVLVGIRDKPMDRVMAEHRISLPPSASRIECGGDAWKRTFIDCGAICTFELPASELSSLLGSLTIRTTSAGTGNTIVPSNPEYAVAVPWAANPPDFAYDCTSPTGDFLTVRTWNLSSTKVGVLLYTDWN